MSFCTKCGAQLAPGARFCPKCGTPAAEHAETAHDATTLQAPVIPPPPVIAQSAPPPPAPPERPAAPPPRATPSPTATPAATAATAATAPSSYRTPAAGSMAHTPVQPAKRSTWWIVPLVIVGLVVLAWLLLAGLPFGGRDEAATGDTPATETIAEGTTTAQNEPITGTVIEVPGAGEPMTTDTTAQVQTTTLGGTMPGGAGAPPAAGTPPPASDEQPRVVEERPVQRTPATTTPAPARTPPARTTPTPQPVRRTTPAPQPPVRRVTPPPASPPPQQASQTPSGEISDAQAAATLRGFISSSNYYDGVSGDCVQVRSHGYRNVGYTFSVWDGCMAGGGSRMLGRWRVDSKTREVFRQREDGRFLRP